MSGVSIAKAGCPECGSSDGVQIFEQKDGKRDAFCFSCETRYNKVDNLEVVEEDPISTYNPVDTYHKPKIKMEMVNELEADEFRGIRKEIVEVFGVKVGRDSKDPSKQSSHFFPSYNQEGSLQGYDHRIIEGKKFGKVGNVKGSQLFGQEFCPKNKKLFVTEGQYDAMSLYQALLDNMQPSIRAKGFTPSVVSIKGITGACKQLEENTSFLRSFKEIILVFDNDKAGKAGTEKVAKTLDHKVLIVDLPLKDANDMLLEGRGRELHQACLYDARPYEPDGIMNAKDAWDRFKNKRNQKCFPYPTQFDELNKKTYGYRMDSVVTITSGTGMGKTQFLRELKYDILINTDFKIADISLEEDVGDTIEGLISLELNKRIHLPDVEVTEEEEIEAFNKLFGDGRVEMYDHFGGMDDSSLFSKLKYFSTTLECQVLIIDHLSIIISETADESDERRRIDAVMTKLAKIAKALHVVIFLVVHLRKAGQGKSFEEGYVPTSDDLRGSAGIKQLSSDIVALSRNQQESDDIARNTSGLHVLKCRFSGYTGEAGHTYFNPITGRMEAPKVINDGNTGEF